jgi:hypothetical protein
VTKNASILSGCSKYRKLPKCCAKEFSIAGKLFAKHREKFVGQGSPEGSHVGDIYLDLILANAYDLIITSRRDSVLLLQDL